MKIVQTVLLLSISGGLFALSCPGFVSPFFLLLFFVPAFIVYTGLKPWTAFLAGAYQGSLGFGLSLFWLVESLSDVFGLNGFVSVPVFIILIIVSAGIYSGLYALLFSICFGPGNNDKTSPVRILAYSLILSLAWPAVEYFRGMVFPAVNINTMASCFYRSPVVIRSVYITGEHLFSFLILWTNISLFLIWQTRKTADTNHKYQLSLLFFGLALLWILNAGYGVSTTLSGKLITAGTGKILSVQANIDGNKKWNQAWTDDILNKYLRISKEGLTDRTEIVIWPETAINFYLNREDRNTQKLMDFSRENAVTLFSGAPEFQRDGKKIRYYNSVFTISGNGFESVYRKERLIPFAEYCPFKFMYPVFEKAIGKNEYTSDAFTENNAPFGFAICFEALFPDLIQRRADGSESVIILSDDIWLGSLGGPEQHLAGLTLRALENKTWVISCVNSGIPAVISPDGNITKKIDYGRDGTMVF